MNLASSVAPHTSNETQGEERMAAVVAIADSDQIDRASTPGAGSPAAGQLRADTAEPAS